MVGVIVRQMRNMLKPDQWDSVLSGARVTQTEMNACANKARGGFVGSPVAGGSEWQ